MAYSVVEYRNSLELHTHTTNIVLCIASCFKESLILMRVRLARAGFVRGSLFRRLPQKVSMKTEKKHDFSAHSQTHKRMDSNTQMNGSIPHMRIYSAI